jgi:Ulp1 family protease
MYIQTVKKRLLVKIPEVQKQTNKIDCGLYAIANAVEFFWWFTY